MARFFVEQQKSPLDALCGALEGLSGTTGRVARNNPTAANKLADQMVSDTLSAVKTVHLGNSSDISSEVSTSSPSF